MIEVNPRSSRTVPYLSKVTGVPMVDLATRCMLGENLRDMGYGCGLYKAPPYVAVKVPVFSFEKLMDLDTQLGPEMKSTGEVLGVGKSLEEALFKGLTAAGYNMQKHGGVFISVRDTDKFGDTGHRAQVCRAGLRAVRHRGHRARAGRGGHQVAGDRQDSRKQL